MKKPSDDYAKRLSEIEREKQKTRVQAHDDTVKMLKVVGAVIAVLLAVGLLFAFMVTK